MRHGSNANTALRMGPKGPVWKDTQNTSAMQRVGSRQWAHIRVILHSRPQKAAVRNTTVRQWSHNAVLA